MPIDCDDVGQQLDANRDRVRTNLSYQKTVAGSPRYADGGATPDRLQHLLCRHQIRVLLVKQAPRSGLHHGHKVESREVPAVLDLLSGR